MGVWNGTASNLPSISSSGINEIQSKFKPQLFFRKKRVTIYRGVLLKNDGANSKWQKTTGP